MRQISFEAMVPDTGEVVTVEPTGLRLPGTVSRVGLALPDGLSFEEWQGVGHSLRGVEQSIMWWIGDWWNYGSHRYGDRARLAAESAEDGGYSFQTYKDAGWVSGKIERSRRRDLLSWSHHKEIAALPPRKADELLDEAEANGWSKNELRRQVSRVKAAIAIEASEPDAGTCAVEDLLRLVDDGRRFGTIYADPPWVYDNQGTRAATGNHYGGLTVDELCALPVRELAAPAAHLHLWTTNAFLFDCQRILAAWGFEFKSTFVWVKPRMGIGNYWRNSHEFLLTGIRGDAKRFNDHSLMSWLESDRGRHSAKPEQVRHMLERASPGPYLEMFGRGTARGWTVWGNQISRSLFDAPEHTGTAEARRAAAARVEPEAVGFEFGADA